MFLESQNVSGVFHFSGALECFCSLGVFLESRSVLAVKDSFQSLRLVLVSERMSRV